MSAKDWPSVASPVPGSLIEANGFTMISTTVDELSYTPSEEQKLRDVEQLKATGRRTYKTLKGKTEAVWPLALEATLLEALESFHPSKVGSRSNKASGRFHRRNRFISDYIFEVTNKRRTPKQVGSRLQQLRDTCKKETILQLISRGTSVPASTSSLSGHTPDVTPDVSPSPSPSTPSLVIPDLQSSIHVRISLQSELWPSPTPRVDLGCKNSAATQTIQLAPLASLSSQPSVRLFQCKSPSAILPFLSGHVQLPSPFQLFPCSDFAVYLVGSITPIHAESVPLNCLSSPLESTSWIYSAELVPSFWSKLGSDHDLSHYTIIQTLRTLKSDIGAPLRKISVLYKFNLATVGVSGPQRRWSNDNSYSPPYEYSCQISSSPTTGPNILYSQRAQRQSPESEDLGPYDLQPIASRYHVEPSFGTGLSSGNPAPSNFTYLQQRCNGPLSTDVNTKYDTHATWSQPAFHPYYRPDSNSNYQPEFSNLACYLQSSGYLFS